MGFFDWLKMNQDTKINKEIDEDIESKIKEEKKEEFENKKRLMKYLYQNYYSFNYFKEKVKSPKINLEVDIYSDIKLIDNERKHQTNSLFQQLLLLRKQVLSAKKGQIFLRKEVTLQDINFKIKTLIIEVKKI